MGCLTLLDLLFESVLTNADMGTIPLISFTLCMTSALFVGLMIAWFYTYKTKYTKSFVMTLTTLPAAVAMVIIMVNGSIGTGVAVAGAFSLIRFRSVPGTAKEISAIFLAMGAGLGVGLGYLGYAILFSLLLSLVNIALTTSTFGDPKKTHRTLIITMPEHLDYQTAFVEPFEEFTSEAHLVAIKTTNMGSLFKLTYDIELSTSYEEKEFIDQLRCRNGNLEISMTKQTTASTEL